MPMSISTTARSRPRRKARRGGAKGTVIGRLDGLPVAIKDNLDVAGMATRAGLPGRRRVADNDAVAVARLRASGAIILGKTQLDEGALGTTTANLHTGPDAESGAARLHRGRIVRRLGAAVAAGLAAFALGTDTLGSVRIPASHCGVYGLKPTLGQISTTRHGARRAPARLRRHPRALGAGSCDRAAGARCVRSRTIRARAAAACRSRRRTGSRAACAAGLLPDLESIGVSAPVRMLFERAVSALGNELGEHRAVDFSDYDFARMRRAALLIMESELAVELEDDLADRTHPFSPRLRAMIDYARGKSAVDYAKADRLLDDGVLKARRVFADVDVLVLPTIAHGPYPLADGERANDADLTSFASIAGCPAISLPMGTLPDGLPAGLQLVGTPGSDLRLLELAEICASTLDAAPAYPVACR